MNFEQFYARYEPGIRRYAESRDMDLADEAVQQTFVLLWKHWQNMPAEPQPLVYATVHRQLNELCRERRRERLRRRGLEALAHELIVTNGPENNSRSVVATALSPA